MHRAPNPDTPLFIQTSLEPPRAIEIVLRAGVVPESNHCQAQWEVKEAGTGTLLAMSSTWHAHDAELPSVLEWCVEGITKSVAVILPPF
jgi:hypothetical protein